VPVKYLSENEVISIQKAYVEKYGAAYGPFEEWSRDVLVPLSTKRDRFSDEREQRLILIDTGYDSRSMLQRFIDFKRERLYSLNISLFSPN